jgi:hypothetical protein
MHGDVPAVQRSKVGELRLLLLSAHLDDGKASMRRVDEVVVEDGKTALGRLDVSVQQVVRIACGSTFRSNRVDEVARGKATAVRFYGADSR